MQMSTYTCTRSYQLIATASKDHYVRIFKLTEPQNNATSTPRYGQFSPAANAKQRNSQRHMQIELVAAFNDHHAEVKLGLYNVVSDETNQSFICRFGVWNGILRALSYLLLVMMANFAFGKQDLMVFGDKWLLFLLIITQHPYHDTNIPPSECFVPYIL